MSAVPPPRDFGRFLTEQRNPRTTNLDAVPLRDALAIINDEDAEVARVVRHEIERIAQAIELIVERRRRDGRVYFVGAGTSGRLGVIEAAEQTPTLDVPDPIYQAIIGAVPNACSEAVKAPRTGPMTAPSRCDGAAFGRRTSSSASRRAARRHSYTARWPRHELAVRDACCSHVT